MKPGEVSAYFLTPELSQRLDLIRHLLANTELIPFVHAIEGSGKTRLARHLADILAEQHTVSLISGGPMAGISDLQKVLAETSGLKPGSEISDDLLEEQFCSLAERDKSLIVLLDDADQLAADSLSWIIRFFSSQNIACNTRFIIFSAIDVLALPLGPVALTALRDTIQVLDIPAFTEEQTDAFVEAMQESESQPLTRQQISQLHRDSSGVPGAILWQMQFVSPEVPEALAPQQNRETWLKSLVLSGGLVFVIVIGLVLIFQNEVNQMFAEPEDPDEQAELQTLVLPPPEAAVALGPASEKEEAYEDQGGLTSSSNQEITQNFLEAMMEEAPESVKLVNNDDRKFPFQVAKPESAAKLEKSLPAEPQEQPLPSPENKETQAQNQPVAPVLPEQSKTVAETPESPAESELEQETRDVVPESELAEDGAPVVDMEKPPVAEKPAAEVVELKEISEEKPAAENGAVLQPESWLLEQSDSNYTLQLLGVREKSGLKNYIKKHKIKGDLFIWETEVSAKPWFSLLYGSFSDRKAALQALKSLPPAVKAKKPWPRPWAPIKKSISTN